MLKKLFILLSFILLSTTVSLLLPQSNDQVNGFFCALDDVDGENNLLFNYDKFLKKNNDSSPFLAIAPFFQINVRFFSGLEKWTAYGFVTLHRPLYLLFHSFLFYEQNSAK